MAAVFDAGEIQAVLQLDRDPFTMGLAVAKAEAQAFREWMSRPVDLNVNVDAQAIAEAVTASVKADLTGQEQVLEQAAELHAELEDLYGQFDVHPVLDAADVAAFERVLREMEAAAGKPVSWEQPTFLDYDPEVQAGSLAAFYADIVALRTAVGKPNGFGEVTTLPYEVELSASSVASFWAEMEALGAGIGRPGLEDGETVWGYAVDLNAVGFYTGMEQMKIEAGKAAGWDVPTPLLYIADVVDAGGGGAGGGDAGGVGGASWGDLFGNGGGGGGGGGGLLAALGWRTGAWGVFAGFGSVLSLMGLGLEHFVATGIGLAGSLAGAFVGAFALMAGAASIFAVGFVTDMAGIGQALGDVKTTYTALSTYQTMSQALAKQIPQTAAAQAALNTALSGFAPAAQSAVLAAALTASQFHWMYNQVTGVAESIGANILNQAMQVGELFLPTLGKYAAKNMGIIQTALQPLFTFLGTTGLAAFTNLENIFTSRLPTSMGALDKGVELLVKTLNFLANQTTGGFMESILKLLTYLNTSAGFARLEHGLTTTIGLFKVWWDLLKQVIVTVYDVFDKSAGLGKDIATTLTQMLKSLDEWISTSSGAAELKNIFTVHKTEAIELLHFLGTLLSVGGQIMLVVIPPFVTLANWILAIGNFILHVPFAGTVVAWGAAILILISRLKLAALAAQAMGLIRWVGNAPTMIAGLLTQLSLIPTRIGLAAIAVRGWVTAIAGAISKAAVWVATNVADAATTAAAWVASAATTAAAWVATGARMVATAVVSAVAMVADAATVTVAWLAAAAAATAAWIAAGGWVVIVIAAVVALVVAAVVLIVTHWRLIATVAGEVWNAVVSFAQTAFKDLMGAVGDVVSWIEGHWQLLLAILTGPFGLLVLFVSSHLSEILGFFKALPGNLVKALGNVGSILLNVGGDIINGLWNGMKGVWNKVAGWLSGLGNIISHLKGPLDYDRQLLIPHGEALMQGLAQGLTQGFGSSVRPALAMVTAAVGGAARAGTSPALVGAVAATGGNSQGIIDAINLLHATVRSQNSLALRTLRSQ